MNCCFKPNIISPQPSPQPSPTSLSSTVHEINNITPEITTSDPVLPSIYEPIDDSKLSHTIHDSRNIKKPHIFTFSDRDLYVSEVLNRNYDRRNPNMIALKK